MKTYSKELPIYCKTDIVVCGGGTAGSFAAISAAQRGKNVLLIEQFGSLGGSATNALVTPFMKVHIEGEPQCSYIAEVIKKRLFDINGAAGNRGEKFDPILLKIVLEELCLEAGVNILYYTYICDVIKDGSTINSVVIANKSGIQLVESDIFIDATGDGDVSTYANAGYLKGNPATGKTQPISLRYTVGGIDRVAFSEFIKNEIERTGNDGAVIFDPPEETYGAVVSSYGFNWTLNDVFMKAKENGDLLEEDTLYWQAFSLSNRPDSMTFNNPEFFDEVDGTNPEHLTKTQIEGKKRIYRQLCFYKKYLKGFEKSYISEIASMVGIRETRHILTEYVLTNEDVLSRKKFDDHFSQCNYPIDVHGKTLTYVSNARPINDGKPFYEIPYKSLVVKDLDNLFVVGRCLGADFFAQSSLRIQPPVRSSGEAAGIAAVIAINENKLPREINGKFVREEMIKSGAKYY